MLLLYCRKKKQDVTKPKLSREAMLYITAKYTSHISLYIRNIKKKLRHQGSIKLCVYPAQGVQHIPKHRQMGRKPISHAGAIIVIPIFRQL